MNEGLIQTRPGKAEIKHKDDAGHATNCLLVLGVCVVPNRVGFLCCRLVAGDGDPLL